MKTEYYWTFRIETSRFGGEMEPGSLGFITEENREVWLRFIQNKISELMKPETMESPEFKECLAKVQEEKRKREEYDRREKELRKYEGGNMKETAGNVLYLLERIGKLWFHKPRLFDPSTDWKISSYEMLLEVSCYILDRIIHDKRTKVSLAEDIPWHLRTINMIYRRPFQSFNTSFDEFLHWGIRPEVFIGGYHYFMDD